MLRNVAEDSDRTERLRQAYEREVSEAQEELREFQREARGKVPCSRAVLPRGSIFSFVLQKLTSHSSYLESSEERIQATAHRDFACEKCEETLSALSSGKGDFEDRSHLKMSKSSLSNALHCDHGIKAHVSDF